MEYLLEELNGLKNYHNAAYISLPFVKNERYAAVTKDAAEYFGWEYHELEGDTGLLERFVNGAWNAEDFLVLEPGQTAAQSYDDAVMKAVPLSE